MKESTARIGDGRKKEEGHDKTVSECFPCLWPEINYLFEFVYLIFYLFRYVKHVTEVLETYYFCPLIRVRNCSFNILNIQASIIYLYKYYRLF